MIQCQNIYKSYDTKTVLNGIDFTIPDGEIFGLLGPSGAGKTTIIKILTVQLGFDKGSVEILDKEVGDLTGEDKKQIGIMMDQFGLYERLSCADNLKIYADIYGIPHSRVKEICRRYNHQKKIILHLSGGEDLELSHGKESAKQIYDLLQAEEIETIHSSEPTLETVFLELTGRDFGEED